MEHKFLEDAWLGLGDTSKIQIDQNLMIGRSKHDIENPDQHLLKIINQPHNFALTCKLLFGIELHPIQAAILEEFWSRPFPMFIASRGFGKSFLMAMYCTLKCIFVPETKIVIVGSGFRQSKVIFEYMETIWRKSAVLRSIFDGSADGPRRDVDRCTMRFGDSWAIAIPLGDGSKIRGLRAHIIIADEFASISPAIYETVVSGFAAVSADPVGNVKAEARKEVMMELGLWTDELAQLQQKKGNQAIVSGTADYSFKHFAEYWQRYHDIIESKGDPSKLSKLFENGEIPKSFNWKDYSIIRIPYELIPKGFMDDKQVSRARATIHSGIYNMEYAACFTKDSSGFFRRSLIESCVVDDKKPVVINGENIVFDAKITGDSDKKYVFGIDPASEQDNFSIVVLELHDNHSRIVYCWTTNRDNFTKRQNKGLVLENDFYGFCARKIRDLMAVFPCERIGMDAQGGGIAVEEALHDTEKLMVNEVPIWPAIDPKKDKETDAKAGKHILEMVQFARYEWTAMANHGLRKDMEDKALLFPRFDNLTLGLAMDKDNKDIILSDIENTYDTLSDCILEIEELKNELTTIIITSTSNSSGARERWDTPETKTMEGKKGRLRKDRYSALIIANAIARSINRATPAVDYDVIGGVSGNMFKPKDETFYKGPDWFTKSVNSNEIYLGVYKK